MKTRNILALIVATVIFSSCSMTLQQRRVADELYQNPSSQQEQEQAFAGYYDEAEKILKDETQGQVDSVIYEDRSTGNPYQDILVDNYDDAYQRRIQASQSLSYGMSDWYGTYYSDEFWYASAYDPSFYNVIVMGDDVWVEPNWLTSHFGTGWKYGSFYNYPYFGNSFMNPYRSTLSMTGIYGFNSMGYGAFSYNRFASPFGYGSFGYSPYSYSPFGSFGYSPFGYSSFGYGSYYGFSPFNSFGYNNYYNQQMQQWFQEEYKLNDEGRIAKFSNHSNRIRKSRDSQKSDISKSYIRVRNSREADNARSVHSVRTRRNSDGSSMSKYVRTRNDNASFNRPRYNRPKREADFDRLRQERVRRQSVSSSDRKSSSTYRDHGSSSSGSRSTIRSGNSSGGSSSSGTRSSGSSSSGGRKRK